MKKQFKTLIVYSLILSGLLSSCKKNRTDIMMKLLPLNKHRHPTVPRPQQILQLQITTVHQVIALPEIQELLQIQGQKVQMQQFREQAVMLMKQKEPAQERD
jgi:hypothetical protein